MIDVRFGSSSPFQQRGFEWLKTDPKADIFDSEPVWLLLARPNRFATTIHARSGA